MFDPLFRSALASGGTAGSVGPGLTLVKRVVDAHGSASRVTSKRGIGTTFRVTLPAAASTLPKGDSTAL